MHFQARLLAFCIQLEDPTTSNNKLKISIFRELNWKKSFVCQLPFKNKDWVKHQAIMLQALKAFGIPAGSHARLSFLVLPHPVNSNHLPPPVSETGLCVPWYPQQLQGQLHEICRCYFWKHWDALFTKWLPHHISDLVSTQGGETSSRLLEKKKKERDSSGKQTKIRCC